MISSLERVTAVSVCHESGRSVHTLLIVHASNGKKYQAKPWHHDRALNLHNSLRGIVAIGVARALGFRALPDAVMVEQLPEVETEVLGIEFIANASDLHDVDRGALQTVENLDDLIRVVFLDLLCLYNDRRPDNTNLIVAGNRTYPVDSDNFLDKSYSTAKPTRTTTLNNHPLLQWLIEHPDDTRRVLCDLEDAIRLMTPAWLAKLNSIVPQRWFVEGGGQQVFEALRLSVRDATEVVAMMKEMVGA